MVADVAQHALQRVVAADERAGRPCEEPFVMKALLCMKVGGGSGLLEVSIDSAPEIVEKHASQFGDAAERNRRFGSQTILRNGAELLQLRLLQHAIPQSV